MRKLLIASALAGAFAAPAFADDHSTLDAVISNGVVLMIQGMEIPVEYADDGTYTADAMGQTIAGKWRIDGANLCTSNDMQPEESCQEYPADKGPGDEFTLSGPMGEVTVKINE